MNALFSVGTMNLTQTAGRGNSRTRMVRYTGRVQQWVQAGDGAYLILEYSYPRERGLIIFDAIIFSLQIRK